MYETRLSRKTKKSTNISKWYVWANK